MKKLVCSAAALSLTSVSGLAATNDWSQLDQEVEALTSSLAQDGGPNFGGWVRARWDFSGDEAFQTVLVDDTGTTQTQDLNGATVANVRVLAEGETAGYGYMVQYDFRYSEFLDASVSFPIGSITGTVGQFKPPIVRSALVSSRDIFFQSKSLNGAVWTGRDQGVMISGEFDALGWWLTLMNGSDSTGQDLFFSGRVDFDLMGPGVGDAEGAVGGSENPTVTAGLSGFNDSFSNKGEGFGLDVWASTNVYSFGGEVVSYGDSGYVSGSVPGDLYSPPGSFGPIPKGPTGTGGLGDSTPWAISGTYMLTPDTWEVGARFQDWDTSSSDRAIEVGVNYYIQGHDLKWQFGYTNFSTDTTNGDFSLVNAGIVLAF